MPRYYFDVHDGFDLHDEIGRELQDLQAVRTEALRVIAGLSATEGENNDGYTIVVEVRDETGANVLTIRMVCQVDDGARTRLKLAS